MTITLPGVPRHRVIKTRDEKTYEEDYDARKLTAFLISLCNELQISESMVNDSVNLITEGLPDDSITVDTLLNLLSESLATRVINHPDFAILAGRVEAVRTNLQCNIPFAENIVRLYNYYHPKTGERFPLVSKEVFDTVSANPSLFNELIKPHRDFNLTYFGIKTLQKSYLIHANGKLAETPQYLFLRVAIGIHSFDLNSVIETYELMSQKYFIHASPTLFGAGTDNNYLSSCFLLSMQDDSIDGIYRTLHQSALISKASGGIGLHVHNIRSSGSLIKSSNGTSSGLVPMLRVFNNTARYVDQGGNKRPGAFAIYLEPWHSDVFDVIDLRKNHGKEEMRARDLFYGLWIPDLFMHRVKNNLNWSLFSPDEAPGLSDVTGDEFVKLYESYEIQGKAFKTVKAQKLWNAILESQTETGLPYMLYKDSCNSKSNQQNLGTIKSSNLCTEIIEYSSPEETAVCNLGSLALPSFIKFNSSSATCSFDFAKLSDVAKILTKNLDKVIDVTKYPIESAKISNKKHRPIAIGVQGLADTFFELRLPFDSIEAKVLNIQIFETIYHAAIEASTELAIEYGPYETFAGSPASEGKLQFDLWNHKPSDLFNDWDELKNRVAKHGLRNSLLVAPMPTASTSQILGFNECFEPLTSNIYTRRVLSGEFQIVNKYLLKDLIDLGIWNDSMKNSILINQGSIQKIPVIPESLKKLYKTTWELSQRTIIDLAADRGKFIDQLQSMNIHLQNPTFGKLTSCHFYAWEKGLKTGMYYLRTQAASRAIQFTVDASEADKINYSAKVADISLLKRCKYLPVTSFSQVHYSPPPVKIPGSLTSFIKEKSLSTTLSPTVSITDEDCNTSKSSSKRKHDLDDLPSKKSKHHDDETYDIYDNTPIACNIKDPENCDSCLG